MYANLKNKRIIRSASLVVFLLWMTGMNVFAACPGPLPTINGSRTPLWSNCITLPGPVNNFNISVAANVALSNYTIIWGDGKANSTGATLPTASPVPHLYDSLGVFTIRIVSTVSGCQDTIYGTVRNLRPVSSSIKPLPSGQNVGCAPHTIVFEDLTENALPGTTLVWTFGDGTTVTRNYDSANKTIPHTYASGSVPACTTQVSLTANNANCTIGPSTYTVSPILILDKNQAVIGPPTPGPCSPSRTYTFPNNTVVNCPSLHAFRIVYWDFGDGTHDAAWNTNYGSRTHTYADTGTYTITLMDSNDCGLSVTTRTITINFPPVVGFTLTPQVGCMPLTVNFNDTSLGNGNTYAWNFGDANANGGNPNTSTAKSPSHRFDSSGTYNVRLRVSNPCTASSTPNYVQLIKTVTVYGKPRVLIGNLKNGCAPLTVTLTDSTKNLRPSGATYSWNFGNGQTSTAKNPPAVTYTVAGTYQVKLIVTDTCGIDSIIKTIRVDSVPTAHFTTTTVCKFDSTSFDASTSVFNVGDGPLTYKWYFVNPIADSSKTTVNPYYTYNGAGFTYRAILKATSNKGCIDYDTQTVTVKVSPSLVINNTPASVCDGSVMTFTGDTAGSGTPLISYQWTFGTGISDTARGKDTAYIFPGPGTYAVKFKANNSINCSNTVTKNITINPIPDSRPTSNVACFNQFTQFRDSSTVGFGNTITQWEWDLNDNGVTDSITKNPTYKFLTPGTHRVRLRVGSNNNCFNTDSVDITVNPIPAVAIAKDTSSLCKLDSFSFSNTTTGAANYLWRFGQGNDSLTTSLAPIKKAYTDSGTFIVKMIATTALGCKDSASLTVTSRPWPLASFTVNDTISCAPKNFVFTNTSILSDNYVWQVNGINGSTAVNRPDTFVATSGQAFTVSLIATNTFGCRPDTVSHQLQTISNPVPVFTTSVDSGCGPLQVNFINASTGATSYQWNLGNGVQTTATDTQTIYQPSALNDSLYSVKLIAFNGPGCKDSISKTIRVFPQPVSSFSSDVQSGCGPLPVAFTNASIHKFGGTIADMLFAWDFGNGQTASSQDTVQTFTAASIQDTLYTVRLIAASTFGCRDTSEQIIRVYPNPRSSFTTNHTDGCGPLPVSFTNSSVPNDTGSISIMSFDWNFGNGASTAAVSPSQTFIANLTKDTVYEVRLIAFSEHSCRDTAYENIRVYPKPKADFVMPQNNGCTPFNALFTNTSVPYDTGDISIMSFVWNLGNGFGNITQDAFGQYISKPLADSAYTVTLFATSEHGCKDTVTKQVTAHPLPVAAFNNNISQGCGPLPVQFTSNTQLASTYHWSFGDGDTSHQPHPLHVFQSYPLADSVFTARLSVESVHGCLSDTVFTNIVTRYLPVADFVPGSDSICSAGSVSFTNQSIGGITNQWNFGNGQTSTAINPVASYTGLPDSDTTYTIRLVVVTPYTCRDTAYKTVKVNPLPDVSFNAVTPGCTPLPVVFNNTSLRAVSQQWDFGDGATDTTLHPSKVFVNGTQLANQQFMVTLRSYTQSGCSDTAKHLVTVYPQPTAFFATSVSEGCGPLPLTFTNQSAADFSGSNGMTFHWDFGNGQTDTARQPNVVLMSNATKDTLYNLSLIAFSQFGCSDTMTSSVRVFPKPAAVFTVSDSVDCGPLSVQFTNTSTPFDTGTIAIMSFVWDFANGFSSVQPQPHSVFNNLSLTDTVYNVKLIAASEHGCRDTAIHAITVKPKPTASFTTNSNEGCGPFDITFNSTSQISSVLNWNFGDGQSAQGTSAIHTYQSYPLTDSLYTASLVTQSAFGCVSDTARKVITARYLPIADFGTSADTVCNPGSVSFFNASQGGSSNSWDFGNGNTATGSNPVTTFSGPLATDTSYTTRLIITSPGSCKDTAYKTINVQPVPDASFAAITPGCTPLAANILNTSLRGATYEWDFGDGTTDTTTHPAKTFESNAQLTNTNYTVTLRAYSPFGCMDTAKRTALVYPLPIANYTSNVVEGCGPLPLTFTNQSAADFSGSNGMTFHWDFGNGQTDTARQPNVVLMSNATKDTLYNLSLIAFSQFGCSDTMTSSVRVFPKPAAVFTVSDSVDCGPLSVQFTNTSTPFDTGTIAIMSFVWDFANGFSSVQAQPQSVFNNLGLTDTVYKVKLMAASEHGCRDTAIHTITVKPKPVASFTTNRNEGCGPFDVTFNSTSQISTVYNWSFGDGQSAQGTSSNHTYQSYPLNDSLYTATLVTQSAFGCVSDTVRKVITARSIPIAGLLSSADSTCNPGTILFFNASQGASSLAWNFGNGTTSSAVNPVVAYTGPSTRDTIYTTRLIASSPQGCRDTVYKTIKVNPTPVAGFANVTAACTPHGVVFNNTSQRASRFEWDFGDGTTDVGVNPTKVFTNPVALANQNYTVTLSAYSASGCLDTAKQVVTVYPLPLANFTANKTFNCDTAEYTTNNGSVGATSYSWRLGSQTLSNQFAPLLYFRTALSADTTHQLKLVAVTSHGCRDSIVKPVLVHPIVKAGFTSNGASSCSNLTVAFTNQSRNAQSHFWIFGDGTGSSQTTPQHAYTQTGSYDVKQIAYDNYGCSDTAYGLNAVEVYEVPSANFLYSPPDAAMPNSSINFRNLSFISNGILSYVWNFGDPESGSNTSFVHEPSHTFSDSGNFQVQLITTSIHNCSDTSIQTIRIRPHPPVPDFTVDPPFGCSPLTVQFTNQSQFSDYYEWTFDDGQHSTDKDPVITFKYPGKYGAFLRSSGPGGVQQMRKDEIVEVFALPRANFFATPTRLILPNSTVSLTDISTDAVKWKWRIDLDEVNYFTDTAQNTSYTFPVEGQFTVTLIALTDKGCSDTLERPQLISVIKGGKTYISNAFTPNGDGTNDSFKPYLQGVLSDDYLFEIYNRWGQKVFSTTNIDEGWDGIFAGDAATPDTYVWVVQGKYVGNIDFSEKGTVTLLR